MVLHHNEVMVSVSMPHTLLFTYSRDVHLSIGLHKGALIRNTNLPVPGFTCMLDLEQWFSTTVLRAACSSQAPFMQA